MISLIVFAASIAAAFATGEQVVAVSQDTLGNYNLKYAIDGISRVEHGDHFGNVNGGFSYIDPHGIVRKTEFTSGVHGYNAIGTDIPIPVQDTPEVAHAKANHFAALHAAYSVPRLPQFQGPEEGFNFAPVSPIGHFATAHVAPAHFAAAHVAPAHFAAAHVAPTHFAAAHVPAFHHVGIGETPEVLAARAQHFAAHAAVRNAHFHH